MLEGWAVIQASWRTGPAETLTENSTWTNGKSLTEEERMTCNNTGWTLTTWGAALLKTDGVHRQAAS